MLCIDARQEAEVEGPTHRDRAMGALAVLVALAAGFGLFNARAADNTNLALTFVGALGVAYVAYLAYVLKRRRERQRGG